MAATIKIKNSSTASAVPTSSDLVQGELAVNVTDKRLFTENASGTVVELGTNPSTLTVTSGATIQGLTVGRGAGAVSTNTAVGASALAATASGSNVVAVGYQAGTAVTSADNSVFVGAQAGLGSTTCTGVTAVGSAALYANTSGSYNVGIGQQALRFNTTASNNTAVGYQAGYANTTGNNNVFIGAYAGNLVTTGLGNTFVGRGPNSSAGDSVTTGSKNTIIGAYTGNNGGLDIRTSSNNIVLSDGDGNPRGIFDGSGNFLVGTTSQLGSNLVSLNKSSGDMLAMRNPNATAGKYWSNIVGSDNKLYVVNNSTTGVSIADGATSWSSFSDERMKDVIEPIADAANKVSTLRAVIGKYKNDADGTRRSFLFAQDVQAVLPEAVDASNPDELGLRYSEVIPLLVAAIQEQQAIIESLTARIEALENQA